MGRGGWGIEHQVKYLFWCTEAIQVTFKAVTYVILQHSLGSSACRVYSYTLLYIYNNKVKELFLVPW